jgi:twitching motility two-component system response regulator PilH
MQQIIKPAGLRPILARHTIIAWIHLVGRSRLDNSIPPNEVVYMFNRILLVASDHSFQHVLAHTLNEEWFETVCADDESAALRLLNETNPELLITEIELPENSGYELCRHIRGDPRFRSLPVVLLDNHFDVLNQSMAFSVGADAYLSKPFDPSEMIDIVGKLLEGREGVSLDQPPSADLTTQSQATLTDSYDYTETRLGDGVDPIPIVPLSSDEQMIRGLQEAIPSRSNKSRYLVLWGGIPLAVLVIVVAAVLVSTYTSSDSIIQEQALDTEKAGDGDTVIEKPQSGETSIKQESSSITSGGGPQTDGNEMLKGVSRGRDEEATRRGPTSGSTGEIKVPRAEITGRAVSQDSSTVTLGKDSGGAINGQLYTPPTRPRRVISSRSQGIVDHLKRSGQEMKKAGKHFGSGAKHFGEGGVKAGIWTGKKVGGGAKRMGTAFKRFF